MPLYQTITVVFVVFALMLITLNGGFADLTPLSGVMACIVLTLFAGYHRIFAGAEQLSGFDSFFTLGCGLIACQLFVPDFRFWWSDFRFIYGMTVLFYFAFCWTFDHFIFVWFFLSGLTLFFLLVQFLIGSASYSGGRSTRELDDIYSESDYSIYDEW